MNWTKSDNENLNTMLMLLDLHEQASPAVQALNQNQPYKTTLSIYFFNLWNYFILITDMKSMGSITQAIFLLVNRNSL